MLHELGFKGIFMVNPAIISVLLFCSVLLLGYFLERLWFYAAYAGWNQEFFTRLKASVKGGRLHDARNMCAQSKNLFARVFFVAISSTHLVRADNENMVEMEKENVEDLLRRRLGVFSTLSFITPLIGLLGTVTGIMQAFGDLAKAGSGGANIVAAGIAEALVSTAAGIVVAVPAAVIYNYFTYKLRSIGTRINNHAHELVIMIYGGEEAGEAPVQPKANEIRAKVVR